MPCYAALPQVPVLYATLPDLSFLTIYAVSSYESAVAGLVQAKEWRNLHSARQLGVLAASYLQKKELRYDFIIPVPLHWSRYIARGYNQATIMALALAGSVKGQLVQPFLRSRATKKQRSLDGVARKQNVARAFCLKWNWSLERTICLLKGKKVLLVDDVYTTGHTLKAFATVVRECKPAVLDAIVACRVV